MCRLYEHITQSTQTDEHLQTGLMRFEEGGGGSIRLLDWDAVRLWYATIQRVPESSRIIASLVTSKEH